MFDYYQPTRLHFGSGRFETLGIVCKPYGNRCFLVTNNDKFLEPWWKQAVAMLEDQGIQIVHYDGVVPNPTIESVEEGLKLMRNHSIDFVLAIGGGSTMDTCKALAYAYGKEDIDWNQTFAENSSFQQTVPDDKSILPIISVPTTSGTGSHVTHASVLTMGEEKLTMFNTNLFSKEAIVDPKLMITLPSKITSSTAFDAFTHAFESYINGNGSPYSKMDSLAGMGYVIDNLEAVLQNPNNIKLRMNLALADTLGGRALANAGACTPHPLSEIIGGILNIPHGEALALVYPAFIKHSVQKYEQSFTEVAKLFNPSEDARGLESLITTFLENIGLRKKLRDFKISDQEFEKMLNHPVLNVLPYGNREYFTRILKDAY